MILNAMVKSVIEELIEAANSVCEKKLGRCSALVVLKLKQDNVRRQIDEIVSSSINKISDRTSVKYRSLTVRCTSSSIG